MTSHPLVLRGRGSTACCPSYSFPFSGPWPQPSGLGFKYSAPGTGSGSVWMSLTFALLHAAPPHLHLCTSCPALVPEPEDLNLIPDQPRPETWKCVSVSHFCTFAQAVGRFAPLHLLFCASIRLAFCPSFPPKLHTLYSRPSNLLSLNFIDYQ
jgi:hypothetical protein